MYPTGKIFIKKVPKLDIKIERPISRRSRNRKNRAPNKPIPKKPSSGKTLDSIHENLDGLYSLGERKKQEEIIPMVLFLVELLLILTTTK